MKFSRCADATCDETADRSTRPHRRRKVKMSWAFFRIYEKLGRLAVLDRPAFSDDFVIQK